jgi:hypothetical protein
VEGTREERVEFRSLRGRALSLQPGRRPKEVQERVSLRIVRTSKKVRRRSSCTNAPKNSTAPSTLLRPPSQSCDVEDRMGTKRIIS